MLKDSKSVQNYRGVRRVQNTCAQYIRQKLTLILCVSLLLSLSGIFAAGNAFAVGGSGQAADAADTRGKRPGPVTQVPVGADGNTHKFVSQWSYRIPEGAAEITNNGSDTVFDYSTTLAFQLSAYENNKQGLIDAITASLPKQIYCQGNNTGNQLVLAGFSPASDSAGMGILTGYVDISWWNVKEAVENMKLDGGDTTLTLYADPVSKPGYLIRVNTRDSKYKDSNDEEADTAEAYDILNLTVTLRDIDPAAHTVTPANPENVTVNLFDYWVEDYGKNPQAPQGDILGKSDWHIRPNADDKGNPIAGETNVAYSTVQDWNKGINQNHLLLFGDGLIHAGLWNKGAGESTQYGNTYAGMEGIVKNVLSNGYPEINLAAAADQLTEKKGGTPDTSDPAYRDYTIVRDYQLAGTEEDTLGTSAAGKPYAGTDIQNLSKNVLKTWGGDPEKDTESLQYLFDPAAENKYKASYPDVSGLFQLDEEGYYYYNMRKNFAEFSEEGHNHFILYDAPATVRTDAKTSIGNFLPFNKCSEVFNGMNAEGKLTSSVDCFRNTMNHHLGMTVDVDFRQPASGMISTGSGQQPMTFQFSGDDDVWVFIDDVLVLDMGGIHSEVYGIIDFSNGSVLTGRGFESKGIPEYDSEHPENTKAMVTQTDLKSLYRKAGKENATQWKENTNTFASGTSHTLKMFYLERGNYDSSIALRFNLQPLLYQQVQKVDQNGKPVKDVEFELYPTEETTQTDGIPCFYTDDSAVGSSHFYVKQLESGASPLVKIKTDENGLAQFRQPDANYFNFADRGDAYYILREVNAPSGYRRQPVDIVLHYDSATTMLSVANRWTTGAYACSVSNVTGTTRLKYGEFTNNTITVGNTSVPEAVQKDGLVMAVPLLQKKADSKWVALYGSNLGGFRSVPIEGSAEGDWLNAVLRAALEQARDSGSPDWHLNWNDDNKQLYGRLNGLPGLASRYKLHNRDGDMQMIYGIISSEALNALGVAGDDANTRYKALRQKLTDGEALNQALETILKAGDGFRFLSVAQFNRDFRSLIYIPNEQRELWVMKIDQNGKLKNGAKFGIYDNENCTGTPAAEGVTASVNGQDGTLIFSPRDEGTADGHATIAWAANARTHYWLKEISPPDGCSENNTVIPVVVGTYSIYADAGTKDDGVSVMAGVGRLTQTMRQYAMGNDVDITLRDITAIGQWQPSANKNVLPQDWKDILLNTDSGNEEGGAQDSDGSRAVSRLMNLHFGRNAMVDYGLHDEDGGAFYRPCFVTDTGFIRVRAKQNYQALQGEMYDDGQSDVNKDNLGEADITNLFSLLNIVVLTDETDSDTQTGSLLIGKRLEGSNLETEDYNTNFQFTVKLTDANDQGLEGQYYFYGTDKAGYLKNGSQIPLHHDESIVVLGLPAGAKFTVTEKETENWHVLPNDGAISGEIAKDTEAKAVFINSKSPALGSLSISKTVTAGGDTSRDFKFTVALTDQNGAALDGKFPYFGDGNTEGEIASGGTVTLKHGESITISELPVGTNYKVTEEQGDDYRVASTGAEGEIEQAKGVYTAAFVNTKREPPAESGNLILQKEVLHGGDVEKEFTFLLTFRDQNGAPLTGKFPYSGDRKGTIASGETVPLKHGQKITISGLPAGTHYTVAEQEADQDGYTTSASGSTGVIEAGGRTYTATFTNIKDMEPGTGFLVIEKNVTGGDTAAEFSFAVTLTDADGEPLPGDYPFEGSRTGRITSGGTVTLSRGQYITISGLPVGTHYSVAEQGRNREDYVSTASGGTAGTIRTDEEIRTVTFTNVKKEDSHPNTGKLVISKFVTGAGDREKDFTFEVAFTDADGNALDEKFSYFYAGEENGKIANGETVTLRHGQSVMISGLPAGARYRVIEREADQDGYTTIVGGGSGEIRSGEEAATASFTNVKREEEPITGAIILSKTVLGSGDKEKDFAFTMTFTDENGAELSGDFPYSYSGKEDGRIASGKTILLRHGRHVTISGLPMGTHYEIAESKTDRKGYTTSSTGEKGVIDSDNRVAAAAFMNIKEEPGTDEKTGGLVIRKTVTSGGDEQKAFNFTVKLTDADGLSLKGDFPYSGAQTGRIASGDSMRLRHGQYIEIQELPAGTHYEVSEAKTERYRVSASGGTGVIKKAGEIYIAAFTNTKISKQPADLNDPQTPPGTGKTPETGDETVLCSALCAASLAGLGLLILIGRRRKNRIK